VAPKGLPLPPQPGPKSEENMMIDMRWQTTHGLKSMISYRDDESTAKLVSILKQILLASRLKPLP
jgi:hypothetical protein